MDEKKKEQQLIDILRSLPERELPHDLTPAVLRSLSPKKVSLTRRLLLIVRTPRIITVTPLRLAYVAMACMFIWAAVLNLPSGDLQIAGREVDSVLVPVTFTLNQVEASSVNLIGSFNGWQPDKYAMRFDAANNMWLIKIKIPAGSHEYAFLIDNERVIADPKADFFKTDGFGSRNSIISATSGDDNFL